MLVMAVGPEHHELSPGEEGGRAVAGLLGSAREGHADRPDPILDPSSCHALDGTRTCQGLGSRQATAAARTLPFKVRQRSDDERDMGVPPRESNPSPTAALRLTTIEGVPGYALHADDQLIAERDRLRTQSDELTMHSAGSPGVSQLLVGIEQEIERITDELLQRARSRHPSTRSLGARPNRDTPTR